MAEKNKPIFSTPIRNGINGALWKQQGPDGSFFIIEICARWKDKKRKMYRTDSIKIGERKIDTLENITKEMIAECKKRM